MEQITLELRYLLIKIEKNGFLEKAEVKEEELETTLQLYLTNRCNLKCIHCYMDSGYHSKNEEISTETFLSVIDDFAEISQSKVVFTGGEPLLRPDFFTLAKRAKEKKLKVVLFTNGTLINDKIVSKIKECVDEIQLSLDGATPIINDEIRGKGVYDKVVNAVRLFEDTSIKLTISTLVMPQNFTDFKNNVESFAKVFENAELKFSFAINEGRADKSYKFSTTAEANAKLQKILKILYEKNLKAMRKIEPNLMARNCGYGETITVSSEGDVYPCAVLKHKAGNLKKEKLIDLFRKIRKDIEVSNVENLEQCPQCDLIYICSGDCRLNNITYNGDIRKPHCPPDVREDFYKKLVVLNEFDALKYWLRNKN
ncbi:MAG: radical SAM protein [Candidatus Aminicenantes bacterium]|nr:radical SAM protein [Candidatus Aminicenantes bacterium]